MRWMAAAAMIILSPSTIAWAQSSHATTIPATLTHSPNERVRVYDLGPDVTSPELLPLDGVPSPPGRCKSHLDGVVELSLLVDETGHARNVTFLRILENDLDAFAQRIARADRFKPGIHDGAPIPVEASMNVGMKGCVVETMDATGKKSLTLWLRSPPEQKLGPPAQAPKVAVHVPPGTSLKSRPGDPSSPDRVGQNVRPPIPLNSVIAEYTPEAKRAGIDGVVQVSLIVDAHGMPQNPRVVKSLDPGLDKSALIAVSKYRFQPAMRDGAPVSVMITVEVNFRIY